MKRLLCAAYVVLSATPLAAAIYVQANATYDLQSNHVVAFASFNYQRSAFDGNEYAFQVTLTLHPYTWLSAATFQDSWYGSIDREASANDYVYALMAVQQFDTVTGQYLDGASSQSNGISIPIRSLLVVLENLDGNVITDFAGWVVFGTQYSYRANDYDLFVFVGWGGNVQSSSRDISGTVDDTLYTLVAEYERKPQPPPDDPGNLYDDSSCQQYQNCHSPIVINLGGGAYQLSGKDDPVLFDIDADGKPQPLAWTAANTPMAFLALDRNGNGRIDDGSELFGNHTPLANGASASNGFQALAQYDTNGDGILDASDSIWRSLVLWFDLNHDGISQSSELVPLPASGVTAISLDYHWTGRRDASGNLFRCESRVWIKRNGKTAVPEPVYDIFFVVAR